jgi:hypothetical protein
MYPVAILSKRKQTQPIGELQWQKRAANQKALFHKVFVNLQ